MSASTSSRQVVGALDARRRGTQSLPPGWQNPVVIPEPSPGSISDRFGPTLESETLVDIADAFLHFDRTALEVCKSVCEKILTGKLNASDPSAVPDATAKLKEIKDVQEQLLSIESGRVQFHRDILKNQFLVTYAGKSMSLLSQMLEDPMMNEPVRSVFDGMIRKIVDVPAMIVRAALDGSMDAETRVVLRQRWIKIKEMSEFMKRRAMLASDVFIPPWADIAADIDQKSSTTEKKTDKDFAEKIQWINTILWATFASNVCLTIPFLWKAYQYSSHTPGTRKDADFWFLIQSCVSQLIGLLISAIGIWRTSSTSVWVWLPPIVVAALCNVLAMPLYLSLPTEWSSFAVVVAGSVQGFMVLQLAIAGG